MHPTEFKFRVVNTVLTAILVASVLLACVSQKTRNRLIYKTLSRIQVTKIA